jgi:Helix-hairpin-helix motif
MVDQSREVEVKKQGASAEKARRMNDCYSRHFYFLFTTILLLFMFTACTKRQNSPQEIREKTAQATAEAKSDAKAVAEGLREGWNRDRPLNLNTASKEDLLQLPGMTGEEADHIIAGRPYGSPNELMTRRIVSKSEYDRISDRVEAK